MLTNKHQVLTWDQLRAVPHDKVVSFTYESGSVKQIAHGITNVEYVIRPPYDYSVLSYTTSEGERIMLPVSSSDPIDQMDNLIDSKRSHSLYFIAPQATPTETTE